MTLTQYLSEVKGRLDAYAQIDYSSDNENHLDIVEKLTDHAPYDLARLCAIVEVFVDACNWICDDLDADTHIPKRKIAKEALEKCQAIAGKEGDV